MEQGTSPRPRDRPLPALELACHRYAPRPSIEATRSRHDRDTVCTSQPFHTAHLGVVRAFVEGDAIEIVARRFYEHMEATARRRVPRDPADWAPVALAAVSGLAI